jgi:hypothetical protein
MIPTHRRRPLAVWFATLLGLALTVGGVGASFVAQGSDIDLVTPRVVSVVPNKLFFTSSATVNVQGTGFLALNGVNRALVATQSSIVLAITD